MSTEEFNYELPEHCIAQTPLKNRSDSKLMLLNRQNGEIEHTKFNEIIN